MRSGSSEKDVKLCDYDDFNFYLYLYIISNLRDAS